MTVILPPLLEEPMAFRMSRRVLEKLGHRLSHWNWKKLPRNNINKCTWENCCIDCVAPLYQIASRFDSTNGEHWMLVDVNHQESPLVCWFTQYGTSNTYQKDIYSMPGVADGESFTLSPRMMQHHLCRRLRALK